MSIPDPTAHPCAYPASRIAKCRLPASDQAPKDARAFVAEALDGSLTLEQDQVVQLLVSELVTNAVRHAQGDGIVIDFGIRGRVRVGVTDESPQIPRQQSPGPDEPGGRGLVVVDQLAHAWGIDPLPGDGKRIWFELTAIDA